MKRQDEVVSGGPQRAPSREELEQHLRTRVYKDEVFRQEFQANPKAVLERDYAQWFPYGKIPSELSIKVITEEEQTLCFVLPSKRLDDLSKIDELDNEDALSEIAGGIVQTGLACSYGCSIATRCAMCNDLRRTAKIIKKIK
jgi:hypothetical protein